MKKIFLFLLTITGIFCSPIHCYAGADLAYPVSWTSDLCIGAGCLQLKSLQDIPALLQSQDVAEVRYINTQNQIVTAKTCQDYFDFIHAGFVPLNNRAIAAESDFKETCDSLTALYHMRPAAVSYLRNFNLKKDYGTLPAAIVFPKFGDAARPPLGEVSTAYPDSQANLLNLSDPNNIELTTRAGGMMANMSVLGWGDFNGDGIDDMLIFIAQTALKGSDQYYSIYILTRYSQNGPFVVLK